jgi:hypothetical protein
MSEPFERTNIPQSESLQSREIQPTTRTSDIAQCVASGVAVLRRVGRLTDANAIEDDDDRPLQG